jgi:hypothetical protein
LAFRGRLGQFAGDLGFEARIAGQAEQVIDPVLFAPRHQRLAGKAGIGAEQDAHSGPARPQLGDDPGHLLDRPGRGVDVGAPQLGRQQVPAAEDVEMR